MQCAPDIAAEGGLHFHVLSFEGPDDYARAGGLASRISGLTDALGAAGFDTHLWFVGDPDLPGIEHRGRLTLHRWCQWVSHFHRGGVYDGEEAKRRDFASSLPPFLAQRWLLPRVRAGGRAVVLAEEWQTVDAVLHLDWLLRQAGVRDSVTILWNANNTFGFERIDFPRLARAAAITTVSRYMRYRMWALGVDPLVIPNGLPEEAFRRPDRVAVRELRQRTRDRVLLAKVARWDPDKRWLLAVDTVGELKRQGWAPLLVARGGVEAHGGEVFAKAASHGLRVRERTMERPGPEGLLASLRDVDDVDIVNLRTSLSPGCRNILFAGAAAVLANSGHEPFGLVGLEAMAATGLACTGATGEDYACAGWNALVLQTDDPSEFVGLFDRVRRNPIEARAIRRRGRLTAERYAWVEILRRNLLPRVSLASDAPPPRVCPLPAHRSLRATPAHAA